MLLHLKAGLTVAPSMFRTEYLQHLACHSQLTHCKDGKSQRSVERTPASIVGFRQS